MAVRTVSVELKMKISDFEAAAAKAGLTTRALGDEFDDLGKKSSKFSTAKPTKEMQNFSRVINAALKDGKTGFQSIQTAIDDTKTHITKLKQEIHTGSGSDSIFGDLRQAQKDLRTLQGIMKDISVEGEQAGKSFTQSTSRSVTRDIPKALANPEAVAAVGAAAVVLWGPVTAALSAAVTAGAGLGVIGAAAAIQRNNPRIVAAFNQLASDAASVLRDASDQLVTPLVGAIGSIDAFVRREGPEFGRLFGSAAAAVNPVVHGLEHLAAAVLPELTQLSADFSAALADPKVRRALAGAENSIVAMFAAFGNHPQEIADGFVILADAVQIAANVVTGFITVGAGLMQIIHPLLTALQVAQDLAHGDLKKAFIDLTQGSADASQGIGVLSSATTSLGAAADDAAAGVRGGIGAIYAQAKAAQDATSAVDDYLNALLGLDNANLAAKQGLSQLTSEWQKSKKPIDENTKAGQNNVALVLQQIANAQRVFDTTEKQTHSVDAATLAYDSQIGTLRKTLSQMGLNEGQIDKLIGKYGQIPSQVTTNVHVAGKAAAEVAVDGVLGALGRLPKNRSVNINVHAFGVAAAEAAVSGILGALGRSGSRGNRWGGLYENRWGGLYQPAADGLLTHAQVYSPVNPGRFMIAEPQTKGEAFIPKNGDYGRSMSILSAAAGWYGAHVVAGGGGGASGSPVVVNLYASDPGGRALVNAIRLGVQSGGGNVVKVLTPR